MVDKMRGAETCGNHHQHDGVALNVEALCICITFNHILGHHIVPCISLVDGSMVWGLLNEAKELAERHQALFADIIRALGEDSSNITIDVECLSHWQ
jgi:hypothetical protein